MSPLAAWAEFVAVLVVFLVSHGVPAQPRIRGMLVARLGLRPYLLVYSAVSILVLAWLIAAAGRAPFLPVWPFAPWQIWAPAVAMLPACLLVAFAIGRPNPLSFGGYRNERFDPRTPGVVRITRHPLLAAIALWSFGHVVPNGDLAHVILFGGFATTALLGMALIDARKRRQFGSEIWAELSGRSRHGKHPADWPEAASATVVLRTGAGLALYTVLILLHPPVVGVPAVEGL